MTLSRPAGTANSSTVADELAIHRVLAWNSQAINDGDRAAYLSTFADDAAVDYWDGEQRGQEAIGAYFDAVQARIKVRDTVTNIVVEVRGDTAWAVATGTSVPSEVAPPAILAQTTITSELAKTGDVWRIVRQEKRADASFDPSRLPPDGGMDERSAILERFDALRAAIVDGRQEALASLLAPGFVGIGFAGQVVDKDRYVAIHAKPAEGEGSFAAFDVEDVRTHIFGDAAYLHGIQSVEARIRLRSRFIQIWLRGADGWLLDFHQETPIVDPASVANNY